MTLASAIVASLLLLRSARAWDKWCGKHYELGAPNDPPPPESYFVLPDESAVPLLDFRCTTASSIYIVDDSSDPPTVVIDTPISWDVGQPLSAIPGARAAVNVEVDGSTVATGSLRLGSTGNTLPLELSGLKAASEPYELRCTIQLGQETYSSESELWYLPPNPYGGSTVKMDRLSGALIVERNGGWEKIVPFGWYDTFYADDKERQASGQETHMDRIERAKRMGMNMIHPTPPGPDYAPNGDRSVIHSYLKAAHDNGLGVMYDMRHSFTDLVLVEEQVREFRHDPGVLVWYTADEPDGPPTPLDSTIRARDLIRRLDPYHPTALVLNCDDYYFGPYSSGTDILLIDVYSVAMNPLWSKRWSTPVNSTFGASGCDNCQGSFYDLSRRLDSWNARLRAMGRGREVPIWVVPQAFDDGQNEFWFRVLTGDEGALQTVLAVNHGALGHCAWHGNSATTDLFGNATMLAGHLSAQRRFIVDHAHSRTRVGTSRPYDGQNGLDVATWQIHHSSGTGKRETETLVLVAQMHYVGWTQTVEFALPSVPGRVKRALFGGVTAGPDGRPYFKMGRTSVAGVILSSTTEENGTIAVDSGTRPQMPVQLGSRTEL